MSKYLLNCCDLFSCTCFTLVPEMWRGAFAIVGLLWFFFVNRYFHMGPLAVVGFHMLDMACIPKSKTLSICAFIFVLLSLTLHNACSLLKKQAIPCVCLLMPSVQLACFLSWLMFNVFIGTDHIATTMTLNFNKKRGCKKFLEWSWHLNHTELENLAKQIISELCLVFTVDARSKPTENRLTRCKTS